MILFYHDLKMAVRSLMKHPWQNLIALVGLAVALFCFSVCLYFSRYIYATDDCFPNKEHILEFHFYDPTDEQLFSTTGELAGYLRQKMPGVEFCDLTHSGIRSYEVPASDGKTLPYKLSVRETDTLYNRVFTPEFLCGDWEQVKKAPNSMVLFEHTARRLFGSPEKALGQMLKYTEGAQEFTVRAVVADLPLNTSGHFLQVLDALIVNASESLLKEAYQTMVDTYALLPSNQSVDQFVQDFNQKDYPAVGIFSDSFFLRAYKLGHQLWTDGKARYLANSTLAAGVLVLLAGLLNFLRFLFGTFRMRVRECRLRQVNGAGFWDLYRMLWVQTVLSVLLVAFFTFLLIELLSPFLQLTLLEMIFRVDLYQLQLQTATYVFGLLLVCGVVAWGVVYRVRRTLAAQQLNRSRHTGNRWRNLSLVLQLFAGWVLLTFGAALYLQSVYTANTIFGTLTVSEKERIWSLSLDYPFWNHSTKKALVDEIRKCSGVEDVLTTGMDYLKGVYSTVLFPDESRTMEGRMDVQMMHVSPAFFRFMSVDLLSGQPSEERTSVVVDEILYRRLGRPALGSTLYDFLNSYPLAGVSKSLLENNYFSIRGQGHIFLPEHLGEDTVHCYVKCYEGQTEAVGASVERILRRMLPESVDVSLSTMMDDIRQEHAYEFKLRGIVLFMAAVCLLIVLLGIYSAITLDTERRRKEVAIRKINGAGVWQIVWLFARFYMLLVVLTAAVALPLAAYLLNLYSRMYISFVELGVLFYGGLILFVVLLVTAVVYVRIRNIARVNPAEVIKSE